VSALIALTGKRTQATHRWRRMLVLLTPLLRDRLVYAVQIGVNLLAVMPVVRQRRVDLLDGQDGIASSDVFREEAVAETVVQNCLDTDPRATHPDVKRR
jgi:hypothetical protein